MRTISLRSAQIITDPIMLAEKDKGAHTQVVRMVEKKNLDHGMKARVEFTRRMTWRTGEGSCMLYCSPTKIKGGAGFQRNSNVSQRSGRLGRRRASSIFFFRHKETPMVTIVDKTSILAARMKMTSPSETKVEVFIPIPKKKTNQTQKELKEFRSELPHNRDYRSITKMQSCFQRWRKLEELDAHDGEAMG